METRITSSIEVLKGHHLEHAEAKRMIDGKVADTPLTVSCFHGSNDKPEQTDQAEGSSVTMSHQHLDCKSAFGTTHEHCTLLAAIRGFENMAIEGIFVTGPCMLIGDTHGCTIPENGQVALNAEACVEVIDGSGAIGCSHYPENGQISIADNIKSSQNDMEVAIPQVRVMRNNGIPSMKVGTHISVTDGGQVKPIVGM